MRSVSPSPPSSPSGDPMAKSIIPNAAGAKFGTLKYRLLTERYAEELEVLQRCRDDVSSSDSTSSSASSFSSVPSISDFSSNDDDGGNDDHHDHQKKQKLQQQKQKQNIMKKRRRSSAKKEAPPLTLGRSRSIRILEEQLKTSRGDEDNNNNNKRESKPVVEILRTASHGNLMRRGSSFIQSSSSSPFSNNKTNKQRGSNNKGRNNNRRKNNKKKRRPHGIMSAQRYDDILGESGSDFDDMHLQHYAARSQTQINSNAMVLSNSYMISQLPKRERRMREMHRACMWSTLVAASVFMRLLTGRQRRFAALITLKRWFRNVILLRRARRKAGLRAAYLPPDPHSDASLMLDHYRPTIEELRDKYFPFLKKFDEMIPIHRPKEMLMEEAKNEREAARKRAAAEGVGIVPGTDNDFLSMMRENNNSGNNNNNTRNHGNNNPASRRKQLANLFFGNNNSSSSNTNNENLFSSPAQAALAIRLNPNVVLKTKKALKQEKIDEERREVLKQQQFAAASARATARFKSLRRLLPLVNTLPQNEVDDDASLPLPTTKKRTATSMASLFLKRNTNNTNNNNGDESSASPQKQQLGNKNTRADDTSPLSNAVQKNKKQILFKEEEYVELEEAAASWGQIDFGFSTTTNGVAASPSSSRRLLNNNTNNDNSLSRRQSSSSPVFGRSSTTSQLALSRKNSSATALVSSSSPPSDEKENSNSNNSMMLNLNTSMTFVSSPRAGPKRSASMVGFEDDASATPIMMMTTEDNFSRSNTNNTNNSNNNLTITKSTSSSNNFEVNDDDDEISAREKRRAQLEDKRRKEKAAKEAAEEEERERHAPPPPLSIILAHALIKKMSLVTGNHLTDILHQKNNKTHHQTSDASTAAADENNTFGSDQHQHDPVSEWLMLCEGRIAEFDLDEAEEDDSSSYHNNQRNNHHFASSFQNQHHTINNNNTKRFSDIILGEGNVELKAKKVHSKGASFGWLLPLPFPHPQGQLLLLGTTCKLWRITQRQFHEVLEEVFDFTESFSFSSPTVSSFRKASDEDDNNNNNKTTRKSSNDNNNSNGKNNNNNNLMLSTTQNSSSSGGDFLKTSSAQFLYQEFTHLLDETVDGDPTRRRNPFEPPNFDLSMALVTETMKVVKATLNVATKNGINEHLLSDYSLTPSLLRTIPMLKNVSDRALQGFCSNSHVEWSSEFLQMKDSKAEEEEKLFSTDTSAETNPNPLPHRHHYESLSLPPGSQLTVANELNNAIYLPCGFGTIITKRTIIHSKYAGVNATLKAKASTISGLRTKSGGHVIRFSGKVPTAEERRIKFGANKKGLVGADELILPRVADTAVFVGEVTNKTLPSRSALESHFPMSPTSSSSARFSPATPASNDEEFSSSAGVGSSQHQRSSASSSSFSLYSTFIRSFLFPRCFSFACWKFEKKTFQKLLLHDPVEFVRQRDIVIQKQILDKSRLPAIPESIVQIKVPLFRFASASVIRSKLLPYFKPKFVYEGQLIPSSPLYADGIYIIVHGQVRRRRYGGRSSTSNLAFLKPKIGEKNGGAKRISSSSSPIGASSSSEQQQQQQQDLISNHSSANSAIHNNNNNEAENNNNNNNNADDEAALRKNLSIPALNMLLAEGRPLREIAEPLQQGTLSSRLMDDDDANDENGLTNTKKFKKGAPENYGKHLEITESRAPRVVSSTTEENMMNSDDNTDNNQSDNTNNTNNYSNLGGGGAHALVYECEMKDPTTWIVLGGAWEGAMEHLPPPAVRKGQVELAPNEKWAAQWDSKWYCGGGGSAYYHSSSSNTIRKDGSSSLSPSRRNGKSGTQQYYTRPRSCSPSGASSPSRRTARILPSTSTARPASSPPRNHNNNHHQTSSSLTKTTTTITKYDEIEEAKREYQGCGYVIAYFIPSSALKDAFKEMNGDVKKNTVELAVAARDFSVNLHPQVISRVINPDYVPAHQAMSMKKTLSYLEKSSRHQAAPIPSSASLLIPTTTTSDQQQNQQPHPSPSPHPPSTYNNNQFASIPLLTSSPDAFFEDTPQQQQPHQTVHQNLRTTSAGGGSVTHHRIKRATSAASLGGRKESTMSNNTNTNNNNNNNNNMTSFLMKGSEPVLAASYEPPQERKKSQKEIFDEKMKALLVPLVLPPKTEMSRSARKTLKTLDKWGIDGKEDNDDGHRSTLKSMLIKQHERNNQNQQQNQQQRSSSSPLIKNKNNNNGGTMLSSPIILSKENRLQKGDDSPSSSALGLITKQIGSKRHNHQTFTYYLDEEGNVKKKSTMFVLPAPQVRDRCGVVASGSLEEEEEHEREEREEEERQRLQKAEHDERERRKRLFGFDDNYAGDHHQHQPGDTDDNQDQQQQQQRSNRKKKTKKHVGFAAESKFKREEDKPISRTFSSSPTSSTMMIGSNGGTAVVDSSGSDDDLPFNSKPPDPKFESKALAKHQRDENDLILHEPHLTIGEKLEVLMTNSRNAAVGSKINNSNNNTSSNHHHELQPHEKVVMKKVDRVIVSVVNGRVTSDRKRTMPYQGPRLAEHHHHQNNKSSKSSSNPEEKQASDYFHAFRAPEAPPTAQASRHTVSRSKIEETFFASTSLSARTVTKTTATRRDHHYHGQGVSSSNSSVGVISLNKLMMEQQHEQQENKDNNTMSSKSARTPRQQHHHQSFHHQQQQPILRFNGKIISGNNNSNNTGINENDNNCDDEDKNNSERNTKKPTSSSRDLLNAAMNFKTSNNDNDDKNENEKSSKLKTPMPPTTASGSSSATVSNFLLQQQISEISGETNLFKKQENELRYRRPVTTNHATNRDWAQFEHCLMNLKKKKKKDNHDDEYGSSKKRRQTMRPTTATTTDDVDKNNNNSSNRTSSAKNLHYHQNQNRRKRSSSPVSSMTQRNY